MNNEDNVYELLGNVQVLTKEGVETKFEELEESLSQKINDALGTSLDEKIDEAVSNAIIDAGGVTTEMLNEVKDELVATDTALQAADTLLDQRITALEAGGGSGGTGDVTTEMLNEVKDELVATDTALQAADTLLDQRITALEAGGGSGGSTTDELLVLTLAVDVEDPADTTTWLLKEAINFDTLYQSYITKTNKPVVINIGMATDTGATQYSFRDVITSAEDTQIRITGDAMSAVIAPNTRFTIDLALIKDEATGNCIINTTESKFLMQEDAGGGSGEAVSEKIFEFTGEYLLDSTADEPTLTVNLDTIDSDKFKEAVDGNYKFQLCLRAPHTQMPIVITTYMYAIQTPNYVFLFNLDSLGMVSNELYGNIQIGVMQNEETGNYELSTYGIDKGDDDSINLVTLDKRVTALEENGSGGGSTDDLSNYTYVIDSQEKFDAFCVATNATEADGNDYSHVYIKNGEYTQTNSIKIDNTVVPVLTITGESKEGVVITYKVQDSAAFACTLLRQDDAERPEVICTVQNCTYTYAHANSILFLTQAYNMNAPSVSYKYTPINFFNCVLNTTSTFSCLNLSQCTVNINFKYTDSSNADSCACILCEQAIDTTIVYIQKTTKASNYILYGLHILKDKNTMCKNVTVIIEQLKERKPLDAIAYFNTCIDCTCTLAINPTNMSIVGYLNINNNNTPMSNTTYAGFCACANLTNCTAIHFKSGFLQCTNLTNCTALFKYMYFYKNASIGSFRSNCGFEFCYNLTNCSVAASNHDITIDNTKANELLNKNKKSLLIDGNVSANNVTTLYVGFYACENLINCHDRVEDIIHICNYARLIYYSFANCKHIQGCSASVKSIYVTNSLSNDASWLMYTYYNSDYITQSKLTNAINSSNTYELDVIDSRQSTSTSLPIKINFVYLSDCSNVSNMYLKFETKSSTSLGTSLFNICAYSKVQNLSDSDVKMHTTAGTIEASKQLTGVHNCTLYSPDTTTCSASQTYVADYAVADTPAGGFNKIVS